MGAGECNPVGEARQPRRLPLQTRRSGPIPGSTTGRKLNFTLASLRQVKAKMIVLGRQGDADLVQGSEHFSLPHPVLSRVAHVINVHSADTGGSQPSAPSAARPDLFSWWISSTDGADDARSSLLWDRTVPDVNHAPFTQVDYEPL